MNQFNAESKTIGWGVFDAPGMLWFSSPTLTGRLAPKSGSTNDQ